MKFRLRIKQLREESGLSQAKLARELGVGVGSVGMWESSDEIPPVKKLQIIANYFDVSLDYLVGRSDTRKPTEGSLPTSMDDEGELLELYRRLPPEFKQSLLSSARLWAGVPASAAKKKA